MELTKFYMPPTKSNFMFSELARTIFPSWEALTRSKNKRSAAWPSASIVRRAGRSLTLSGIPPGIEIDQVAFLKPYNNYLYYQSVQCSHQQAASDLRVHRIPWPWRKPSLRVLATFHCWMLTSCKLGLLSCLSYH